MTSPWKTVPVEPTEEMQMAGALAHQRSVCHDFIGPIDDVWAAMLAAAPQQGPMTEERINKLRQEYLRRPGHPEDVAAFVRAIEQFHGIKQQASDEGGGG